MLWDGAGFDESGALLTETIALREFPVVLFGASHVVVTLVWVLANLPCYVVWVDERDETFPPIDRLPPNVTMDASGIPEAAVDEAPANSYFLVMTHNHALDLALAERILRRGDFAYFGMIGSHTKKVQFERRRWVE
ncbi:MAG: unnamed protein product [Candidatus Burkholderia crenata]|nr:MAG: unnamed protein product [Candidatus Burkholderia crenata]